MTLLALPIYRLTDSNGIILPNARLYTFLTGTTTPAPTYTTPALIASHGNYVQADSAGLLPAIYLDPSVTYRMQVRVSPYAAAVSGLDFDPITDRGLLGFKLVSGFDTFQDALDYIGENGGTLAVDIPTYASTTQLTLTQTTFNTIHIIAYGAKITTTGAISGLKIVDSIFNPAQIVIEGLTISQLGNATATAGFEVTNSTLITFRNCVVEAHSNSASYAGFWLYNKTASDDTTGVFWCTIETCSVRKQSTGTAIPCAIRLQGAANATRIIGGAFGGTITKGVHIVHEAGQTTVGNAIVIDGASFEDTVTAIHVEGATTYPIGGLRVINNRHEAGTTFLSLTGTTTLTASGANPIVMEDNYVLPGIVALSNPNGLLIKPVPIYSGVATFAAATTVTVTLPYAEPDGNYGVVLTPLADPVGRLYVPSGSKGTASFVITNTSSTSISVGWQVYR